MAKSYSRYASFKVGAEYAKIPFIKVPAMNTDKYTVYKVGQTRLDQLSYQYYNNPNYGWLILQANPDIMPLEFKIDDGQKIRIPYPLESAIQGYEVEIDKYKKLYGLN